jgi:hypothetical protein
MVEDAFRATTLAEVLAEPNRSAPLCDIPARQEVKQKSPPKGGTFSEARHG